MQEVHVEDRQFGNCLLVLADGISPNLRRVPRTAATERATVDDQLDTASSAAPEPTKAV